MMNRLEDLWKSANDGAFTPVVHQEIRDESEFDDLLDAWYVERRNCIECEILLDQSKVLISHLINDSDASPAKRKQARRLILAIDRAIQMLNDRDD
jgi:hypothetical protein